MLEINKIYHGNAPDIMKTFPGKSINCCITSPPYWGLRDYGTDPVKWPEVSFCPMPGLPEINIHEMNCSLGLEPDPWPFVGHMVLIFRELHRILKDDGTLWMNFGDSYASNSKDATDEQICGDTCAIGGKKNQLTSKKQPNKIVSSLKAKDMVGIPWRVAFALQADGWYLRQDIIWAKPNPMPESVTDRCTKSHEYIFLLSKAEKYYCNMDAIKERAVSTKPASFSFTREVLEPFRPGQTYSQHRSDRKICTPSGWDTGKGSHHSKIGRYEDSEKIHGNIPGRSDNGKACNKPGQFTRNKRSVWNIPTKAMAKAHFATFPPKLIEPCILAGSPKDGIVLDMFVGSGTVPFVATENNRNWIGIDLSKIYIEEIANQRIKNAEPQLF